MDQFDLSIVARGVAISPTATFTAGVIAKQSTSTSSGTTQNASNNDSGI